jgi:hypothetical protein
MTVFITLIRSGALKDLQFGEQKEDITMSVAFMEEAL